MQLETMDKSELITLIKRIKQQRDDAIETCRAARTELVNLGKHGVARSASVMILLEWTIDNANNEWEK